MHKYETNLASEFYVLAALYRLGANAAMSLGNKNQADRFLAKNGYLKGDPTIKLPGGTQLQELR